MKDVEYKWLVRIISIVMTMCTSVSVLETFDSVKEPQMHQPEVGDSLTLRCHPPKSYPSGQIYWGESTPGARFQPLTDTERRLLDYDGK